MTEYYNIKDWQLFVVMETSIVLGMFFDMSWRCGISCYCTRHVFGHVLTVWYFLLLYSACFWTCPDGVVFLVIVLGMFLDMSWRCGISCYCTRHVFGHVLTVWYFLLLYSACFWTCPDGVVFLVIVLGMFLDMSWRCGISCYCTRHVFGHVLTVWYFLLLYSACFWTCPDGVVFLVIVLGMFLDMSWRCGISCYCTRHVFGHVLTVWYVLLLYSACFWTCPDGVVCLVIVLDMFLDMSWRCGISCYCTRHVFGHVLTVWYFLLLYSACFWTCPDGVVFLVIVLGMFLDMSWRCGISCYCTRHVFGHVLTVWYFLLLYSACFWTCPDGVVFLVIVLGMFLDMSWRCGISCYCTRHVFGHVLTVWYFLLLYSACFWTCPDGVVFLVILLGMFLDMSWRCGISCYCTRHVFGHVLTVWYFLLLYSACFWTCPDGVVFLVIVLGMFLDMSWRCGISCYCTRHVFGHVLTVWYFLLLYSACFWTCPDGVVFLVIVLGMFLDMFWRCGISCYSFSNAIPIYSQTCIRRSPMGQRKSGLIRQVTS